MSTSQKPHFEHHESVLNESVKEVSSGSLPHEEAAVPMAMPMPIPPFYSSKVAAIGFASFATGALMMGLYCIGLLTNLPQVVVGVALGYTGICQFASGLMEMVQGNTYAATTMMTYSGFFFSFGIMFSPASGFLEVAEKQGMEALETCVGLYMLGYAFISFLFFLGTFRQPYLIQGTLLQVFLSFFFSCLGNFLHNHTLIAVSGWISISLALTAYYVMATLLYDDTTTFIKLPSF